MNRDTYLLFYLCNESIRKKVLPYLNPSSLPSKLSRDIVKYFTSCDGRNVPAGEVLAHLSDLGYEKEVIDSLSKVLFDFNPLIDKEHENCVLKKFNELVKKINLYNIVLEISKSSEVDPDEVFSKIEGARNVGILDVNLLDYSDESVVEKIISSFKGKKSCKVYLSSLPSLNKAFLHGGYRGGTLVMLVGATGRGKTFFVINECVSFLLGGAKVLYLALGDMTDYTMLLRFLSRLSLSRMEYLLPADNFMKTYREYKDIFNNLRVVCVPALSWNSKQLYSNLMQIKDNFDFDVFIVDYDLNVAKTTDDMYEEGGYLYGKLAEFCQSHDTLGLVVTQPKVQYWDAEIIPEDGAAESSRKQHHVDAVISFGKKRRDLPVGRVTLVKVREGVYCTVPVFLDLGKAYIKEISEQEYGNLLSEYGIGRR